MTLRIHIYMINVSVEIPQELLNNLDEHVGDSGKFVNRSDAIDERHGRIDPTVRTDRDH